MDKIKELILVPTQGSYYYEDVAALHARSIPEELKWTTAGVTPGFTHVRELADTISVGVRTTSGHTGWGECVAVSYSGKAGREGLFHHAEGLQQIGAFLPSLVDQPLGSFRRLLPILSEFPAVKAVSYGLSQALLSAVAIATKQTMCEVILHEWDLPIPQGEIPIQGSSGNNRTLNAEKMIINRLAALPQSQIDDIPTQLGQNGEILLSYVGWLKQRIQELSENTYLPTVSLDVHGAIGKIFEKNIEKIATYLLTLEKAVSPYPLRMESVILGESRDETIELLIQLKSKLLESGSAIKLCADEWANTKEDILHFAASGAVDMIHIKMPDLGSIHESIDAVLGCKKIGVDTLLGGSCIETEISSRISVHIALATRPTLLLAKPGMGIDEAIMLTKNEMRRTLLSLA